MLLVGRKRAPGNHSRSPLRIRNKWNRQAGEGSDLATINPECLSEPFNASAQGEISGRGNGHSALVGVGDVDQALMADQAFQSFLQILDVLFQLLPVKVTNEDTRI